MYEDYENFVGRMGSFEDVIELTPEDNLEHSGKNFVDDCLISMGDTILFDF